MAKLSARGRHCVAEATRTRKSEDIGEITDIRRFMSDNCVLERSTWLSQYTGRREGTAWTVCRDGKPHTMSVHDWVAAKRKCNWTITLAPPTPVPASPPTSEAVAGATSAMPTAQDAMAKL